VKAAGACYRFHVPIILKSGGLNLLEFSGPVQAYNGIALTSPVTVFIYINYSTKNRNIFI
jgi:hypothetical protein